MVPCLRGVVEQRSISAANDILKLLVLEFRTLNQSVQIVNVGLLMITIVILYGCSTDRRSQSIVGVR